MPKPVRVVVYPVMQTSEVGLSEKCGALHFRGDNLCILRLACRAISASAELLVSYWIKWKCRS